MKELVYALTMVGIVGLVTAVGAGAAVGPPAPDAIWGDDVLYRTVATPTAPPNKGPKDGLFMFTNLDGQSSVAEAKPGDQDYNGGRWTVYMLAFTEGGLLVHDPDGDGTANFELTNWEEVEHHIYTLGHLEIVGTGSLICPMIPQR
jgi:hypothetical protein